MTLGLYFFAASPILFSTQSNSVTAGERSDSSLFATLFQPKLSNRGRSLIHVLVWGLGRPHTMVAILGRRPRRCRGWPSRSHRPTTGSCRRIYEGQRQPAHSPVATTTKVVFPHGNVAHADTPILKTLHSKMLCSFLMLHMQPTCPDILTRQENEKCRGENLLA